MLGQLIPCGGGNPIPLLRETLTVGRRDKCDITLSFSNVSANHCTLELVDGYWKVTDHGSTNGVKVNGERVESRWLMPGDQLRIAKHEFEVVYTPQTNSPPPEQDMEEHTFSRGLLERAGLAPSRPSEVPRPASRPQTES